MFVSLYSIENNMTQRFNILLVFLAVLLLSTNCISPKKTTYLQNVEGVDSTFLQPFSMKSAELRVGDVLYVNIYGIEGQQLDFFNKKTGNQGNMNYQNLIYQGLLINSEGNILLPEIGEVNVKGLSIERCRVLVQEKVSEYLKGALVDVRLVTYQFSVLGEVKTPGLYDAYDERINVIEAISRAGDFNQYGNKKTVMLIRTIGDKKKMMKLDFTDSSIFQHEGFWIKPGDVIVVNPVGGKAILTNTSLIQLFLTTLTTLILFYSYIKL
jgi:polysaccharide export outer membrane protein